MEVLGRWRSLWAVLFLFTPVLLQAEDDAQFLQIDDWFVSRISFEGQDWMYVNLAKLTKPASPQTGNQSQYLRVADGSAVWTSFAWQTRIPPYPQELKVGTIVVFFELFDADRYYLPPPDKATARAGNWIMARITDLSQLYQDQIGVSGDFVVRSASLRVLVPNGK